MRVVWVCIAVATALALGGCESKEIKEADRVAAQEKAERDSFVTAAKAAVARDMKDPASAQFRDVTFGVAENDSGKNYRILCGAVNAKNGYGAYAGYSAFVASESTNHIQKTISRDKISIATMQPCVLAMRGDPEKVPAHCLVGQSDSDFWIIYAVECEGTKPYAAPSTKE